MIIFGLSFEEKRPEMIPIEVAHWLSERHERFPLVEFRIEVFPSQSFERDRYEVLRKRYKILFYGEKSSHRQNGDEIFFVKGISFLYPDERWHIRIAGGVDAKGVMIDIEKEGHARLISGFPYQMRYEIFGIENLNDMTSFQDEVNEGMFYIGKPFEKEDLPFGDPSLVFIEDDGSFSSDFTVSGKEEREKFLSITHGTDIEEQERFIDAYINKDWKTLQKMIRN